MNWKLRIKNKATLVALIAGVIALVYQVIGWFGIVPKVAEGEMLGAASMIINLLVLLGVIVDPTTDGIKDTKTALGYTEPRKEQ